MKHAKLFRFGLWALHGMVLVACTSPGSLSQASKEWPYGGGDWHNTRFSPLTQIAKDNLNELKGAWRKPLTGENSTSTPVVRDGVMYVIAGSHVYAMDAATGESRWTFTASVPLTPRAVTLGETQVFVGTRDAHLIALDIKSGSQLWSTMVGDEPVRLGQMISGAPGYAGGALICALANGDFGLRGRILSVDPHDGHILWRFDTIPGPGEPGHDTWPAGDAWVKGGAGVWTPPAFDLDLGLVYMGVGNAVPQWSGELREGDNLYTGSVIALDIKTGKLRWYYQLVHHDLWDHDVGTPLVLFDAAYQGRSVKALAAIRTDAYLFVLDRATGKPVYPVEERAVPQNAFQKTAKTQPFPVGAEAVGPRCVEADSVPAGFARDCYFDPIDDRPNIMALIMAARSAPMSYDPQTGYFYVTVSVAPFWVKRGKDPWFFYYTGVVPGMKQYGILAAINAQTGKIAWQQKLPYKIQNGSGVLTTAGGVAFHGHPDGHLMAFDAKTGSPLWRFQLGSAVNGPVVSYEVNGTQYLAVAASESIWVLKRGGSIGEAPPPFSPPTTTSFVGTIEDADHVTLGGTLSDGGLMGKRVEPDPYALSPQRVRLGVGESLTFTNTTSMPHHLRALDGSWDSGVIGPNESKSVKMPGRSGTTTYICTEHPWTYGELTLER